MTFSLTIGSKTFSLQTKRDAGSLQALQSRHGWLPWMQETSAGGWQRNENVNVDTALRNPTLFACVTLIAGDISKLRPMLVQQDSDGIWSEIRAGSPFLRVLDRPNSYQTWADYAEWYITSKLMSGNVYALKERDGSGLVRGCYILDPFRVKPLIAPDGSVFYQLTQDVLSQISETVIVPAREMIHDVMCPLFHPLVGVSPIYAAGFPSIQGLNLRDAQDKFVSNGSRPGGILMVPGTMKQTDVEAMKTEWQTSFTGANQGNLAVLTGGMSYLPLGMMTAEQSRVIEQLHLTDEDIAKCFHMPRHKVGIGPDPTYTNIEAKNQDYYNDCLQTHINKFQIKHTKGLELDNVPGKTFALELDLDDLLLMDMTAKADAATKAVTGGLSFNEARFRFWDVGPVKGGESPLAQEQNHSLEALAKRDAGDPFAVTAPERITAPAVAPVDPNAGPVPPAAPAKQWNPFEAVSSVRSKVAELRA